MSPSDDNGSWDSDDRAFRDDCREPARHRTPVRRVPLNPNGTVKTQTERALALLREKGIL